MIFVQIKKIVNYRNLGVFFIIPVLFSIFFWVILKSPFAQIPDIAVIYLLVLFFAILLVFNVNFKEFRKFIFYQILPYLIILSEMINFELYTQFDAENPIRYGFALSFMGLLADICVTLALSCFNLRKISAIVSTLWQICLAAPFTGIIFRNIFGKSKVELETITAIYQTDLTEALSYVWEHESILLAIILLLILIGIGIFIYSKIPIFRSCKNIFYRLAIVIICVFVEIILCL